MPFGFEPDLSVCQSQTNGFSNVRLRSLPPELQSQPAGNVYGPGHVSHNVEALI